MNKQLQELADVHYGKSPANIRAESSDIPIYATSGQVGWASQALFDGPLTVIARKGTLDNPTYSAGPCWVIDTAYAVIPKQNVDGKWLYYALSSFNLGSLNEATGVPSISRDYLYRIALNTPDYPEQHKIARILSTVDDLIERTEALIAKYRAIKQGLMHDLLTRGVDASGRLRPPREVAPGLYRESAVGWVPREWEVVPIEAKLQRIIDYRGRTPDKTSSGVPLITAKNVREGYIVEEPREHIAENQYEAWMTRGLPQNGDILFTTEAPLGNVARIPDFRFALAQRVLNLRPLSGELVSDFLLWLLLWKNSRQKFEQKSTGSTVLGIKQSVFRKVVLQFPSPGEQGTIANVLNSHDAQTRREEEHLAKLRSIKAGLMQNLLTGRVRVDAADAFGSG